MQHQIKSLLSQGLSIRKVAQALNVSRQTVRKYGDSAAAESVSPESAPPSTVDWDGAIDWKEVARAASGGTTVKQLHTEYAPEGVSYTQFRRRLRTLSPPAPAVAIRLEHKPGERTQIDYCDGIGIVDATTGEVRKTHLFCGVLPFSSYAFGEFV
jgi:transposase